MYYNMKNPHGGDIYGKEIRFDFSANVNPFGAPASVLKAAEDALREMEKYPDPYCRELVKGIADAEELPEEYVFCGNGASEVIYAYCQALRPKKALLTAPTFGEYETALRQAGCGIDYYYLKKETGFAVEEDLIDQFLQQKPDVVFLCNPNNPTGRPVREDLLVRIVSETKKAGIRLFVDECFYELSDKRITLKDRLKEDPGLFLLRAFTKSFAMAGLRLGYCLCSDKDLLTKMSGCMPPWSISGPAQAAGIAAIPERQYLEESVQKIRTERTWLSGELAEAGLTVYPSEVNYIFFEGPEDLQERLRDSGIEIRSCANYQGLCPGYYRIAVRTHEENESLVRAIQKLME